MLWATVQDSWLTGKSTTAWGQLGPLGGLGRAPVGTAGDRKRGCDAKQTIAPPVHWDFCVRCRLCPHSIGPPDTSLRWRYAIFSQPNVQEDTYRIDHCRCGSSTGALGFIETQRKPRLVRYKAQVRCKHQLPCHVSLGTGKTQYHPPVPRAVTRKALRALLAP